MLQDVGQAEGAAAAGVRTGLGTNPRQRDIAFLNVIWQSFCRTFDKLKEVRQLEYELDFAQNRAKRDIAALQARLKQALGGGGGSNGAVGSGAPIGSGSGSLSAPSAQKAASSSHDKHASAGRQPLAAGKENV